MSSENANPNKDRHVFEGANKDKRSVKVGDFAERTGKPGRPGGRDRTVKTAKIILPPSQPCSSPTNFKVEEDTNKKPGISPPTAAYHPSNPKVKMTTCPGNVDWELVLENGVRCMIGNAIAEAFMFDSNNSEKACSCAATDMSNEAFEMLGIAGANELDTRSLLTEVLAKALSIRRSNLYAPTPQRYVDEDSMPDWLLSYLGIDQPECPQPGKRMLCRINESSVAEVFASQEDAKRELSVMRCLEGMRGIMSLTCDSEIACVVSSHCHGSARKGCYALTMAPSCEVLSMSTARPHHFAQYARILATVAHERHLNHNYLSLDCLLLDHDGNCFISDWDSATALNTQLPCGFGKPKFGPCCLMLDAGGSLDRLSSLRLDLECLYMLAICCSLKGIPWLNADSESVNDECEKWCGLGTFGFGRETLPQGEWAYLARVAETLCVSTTEYTEQDVEKIIEAFCEFEAI